MNFIFFYIIGLLPLLLLSFSRNLHSESYSSYLKDDFKAVNDYGRVLVKTTTRLEESVPEQKQGFQSFHEISLGGLFRSQKGGEDKDTARKNTTLGQGNSQIGFYYLNGKDSISFIFGPRLLATQSQTISQERKSAWDGEAILSYTTELRNLKLSLEGGRGWQRLDGFGFLFNGIANYGQFQIDHSKQLSLSLVSLSFKPEEESLTPAAWNYGRKELLGGALRSREILFWENLQLFHYVYREPNSSRNPSAMPPTYESGSFLYSGLEFRSQTFWNETSIDLVLIRTTGLRKNKTYPWGEHEQTTNSILGYGSLHGKISNFLISIAGLYSRKDQKSRIDSESNGYAAPLAEPRVLGGYSSFLLYQSISFPNDNIYSEFSNKNSPGFENKGQRMIGLQIGSLLFSGTRGDVFLNRASSEIGTGTEMILKSTTDFDPILKGFFSASICYALVNSNKKTIWISEPFVEQEKEKEFWRFYLSSGIQF